MSENLNIAAILDRIATYLEIKGENVFKIKAYHKAADSLRQLGDDVRTLRKEGRLSDVPGIGKTMVEKIGQYLDTGTIKAYENLKKEIPESLLDVVEIPSVGPKKARLFYDKLKVKDVDGLKKAAEEGRLQTLEGIREKTVANILKGIEIIRQGEGRMNLGLATTVAERVVGYLKGLKTVKQIEVAGSLRRRRETIRDIDVLVVSSSPKSVMDAFTGRPGVKKINAKGGTKASVVTEENVQVDLRVVEAKSFGAALLYFTGSKNFNIHLRQIAQKKKMKVNEYGVFQIQGRKEKPVAGKTEKECLRALGLPMIPPELREDIGEKELYDLKKTPSLIALEDIRGDLHMHSTWSDGRNSIKEMAEAGRERGYKYVAIADHSQQLRVAGGVPAEDLPKKKEEIDKLNDGYRGFRVLFATEVEIDTDGKLDYNDDILSRFDFVIAAVHSGFKQSAKQLTKRLINACKNRYVHAIAHPTGVHLGKREPYAVDLREVCKAAADTNTWLEINSFPVRLDLNGANVYFARQHKVRFVINTDSHAVAHLDHMRLGVATARRGWLQAREVVNTQPLTKLMKELKR